MAVEYIESEKLGAVSEYIKQHTQKGATLSISSPFFTIFAFEELSEVLDGCNKLRFLFNKPNFIKKIKANKKDVKEFELRMTRRERNISEFNLEIGLKNNLDQNQIANKCYDFIKEKAEVRSIVSENSPIFQGIIIENPNGNSILIQGNTVEFSKRGLGYSDTPNYDVITAVDDTIIVDRSKRLFKQFFENVLETPETEDVKEKLLEYLSNLYKENSPELIYYLTLYNVFGEKLINIDEMAKIKERTGITKSKIWNLLYNFQHDAVVGAIKKLELFNGCIIADSVGLGKTFEALAIIKYYELRHDRVLVLCPKKLRNNWIGFKQNSKTNILVDDRFGYSVLNHTDLSREKGLTGDVNLSTLNWGNYELVVIDESHNFRNNDAVKGHKTRYQKLMEDIIREGVNTKVLMLSATPVNNSFNDLKNQIFLITGDNDTAFSENLELPSIENTLRKAQTVFNSWSKQDIEQRTVDSLLSSFGGDFYKLLNAVTIARSRKHIQTYYDTKDIGEFPERNPPISEKTDLDTSGLFPKLSLINKMIAELHLAVYSPMSYIKSSRKSFYDDKYDQHVNKGQSILKQADREKAIVDLMRINLLKRMESSVNSFALTLSRINSRITEMLKSLNTQNELNDDFNEDSEDFDDDVDMIGGKIKISVTDIDKVKIMEDLKDDQSIIQDLLEYANQVDNERDLKLLTLKEHIKKKINNPINCNNKKVIIFTTFADTAEYIYKNISTWILNNFGIYSALVTGSESKNNHPNIPNDFDSILAYFSPISNHFNTHGNDLDIVIATDCISEGQNLQDCDYLVNYDIHWNPVRIVQRFGRIDRIGSKNKRIQMVNFWPNMELEEYINLEKRVRNKMVILDLSATADDNVIGTDIKKNKYDYRKNQLQQLQNKVLDIEDLKGGISITDLTMDDFFLSLDRFMKDNPELLKNYPTGVYAITNSEDKIQNECVPGVIFCLKQKRYLENNNEASSLYPYYIVYIREDGNVHISNVFPKKILDIYKALCQGKTTPQDHLIKFFNKETTNGSNMKKYTELLEKAVFDIKGISEQKGCQSIFQRGPSTFLNNKITGLNDFELISFLVVK